MTCRSLNQARLLALVVLPLLAAQPAWADDEVIVYVQADAARYGDGSIDKPFRLIQQGIDACPADGTVRVLRGSYYESLLIDKPLHLHGEGIDAVRLYQGDQPSVVLSTADVLISGIVFMGDYQQPAPYGMGLRIVDSERVSVACCKFPNLEIGVRIEGSDALVADSILEFMQTAVLADGTSTARLYANVTVGNAALLECAPGALYEALANTSDNNGQEIGAGCVELGK